MEVKSIIEEFEMQSLGGLLAARELVEKAFIPSLLGGTGTWFGKCDMTVKACDGVQNCFWRLMLEVSESCPKIALRSETKMLGMKWRAGETAIVDEDQAAWQEPWLARIRAGGD